ncbi:Acetyl-coenzyme A synthetase [Mycena venus]|uniref:acetate--CoA ligase n=1 Tax=Mycena venus TaxID=2733690 RepID=A0A8H7CMH0_9AGAR|nr:Acetyl-coenzyme A synthetase [Mycena venus]
MLIPSHRLGANHVIPSLCILWSVGEPINSEAWNRYNEHLGEKGCTVVDTFGTETGSIIITPFPRAVPTKLGSATVPFFGHEPVILDPMPGEWVSSLRCFPRPAVLVASFPVPTSLPCPPTQRPLAILRLSNRTAELQSNSVKGVLALKTPWPSIARAIWQDHAMHFDTYMKPYLRLFYTGDGAARDEDGYIQIKGQIGAEIESALIMHKGVAETAVIDTADELTGKAVYAFVTLKPEFVYDPNNEVALAKELVLQVRKVIGPFSALKKIYIVPDLPKTRSGKIMLCIMRQIVAGKGDQLGDLSTAVEPGVVDVIKQKVAENGQAHAPVHVYEPGKQTEKV